MAGGKDRSNWDLARQQTELSLRQALAARGIEIPRTCPGCGAALEALRDNAQQLVVRCAGRCGRVQRTDVLRDMRRSGAALLPGFE